MVRMSFLLPSEYTQLSQLPTPRNPNVTLSQLPGRVMAVMQFSGWCDETTVATKSRELQEAVERDAELTAVEGAKVQLARYNPPFTIPFLRTNEVMLPVEWKPAATAPVPT